MSISVAIIVIRFQVMRSSASRLTMERLSCISATVRLLHVGYVKEVKKCTIPAKLVKFLGGKHVGTDWGGEFVGKEITIEALDDSRFELDGEIIEDTTLNIKVVHDTLKMFR